MLESTFHRLIRGVNAAHESQLWRQGIHTWDALEREWSHHTRRAKVPFQAPQPAFAVLREALRAEDAKYFHAALHRRDHYRIALAFPHRTVFLDLETTGLSRYYDVVTLVGWSYGGRYRALIRGDDPTALYEDLRHALVLVTFNGSLFDIPFLRQEFAGVPIPSVHLDLRFLAKRVGQSGGQKKVEADLGFTRPSSVCNMTGEAAPLLWHRYRKGDIEALKLLIEYNHSDIEGMKHIFDRVLGRLARAARVPHSVLKELPRFADRTMVEWRRTRGPTGIRLRPYPGDPRPAVTLDALLPSEGGERLRVVGIDLTGSEARESGWCLLDGDRASTRRISRDDDLISATLEARPHLVSIDSPLSLPFGRVSVSDDDPGRLRFGTMRSCERTLKRRGVNVYPALIPSMQRLTARGIELAARLRQLGVPVIESYPGAAQDIIGIPRKRASVDMLREGLIEFGICGALRTEAVSHDELDAITAAIVGVFFWSGRFEALGGEVEEEALIVPDLNASAPRSRRCVIGFSGPIAAGKTTAARYLESKGYQYARYSAVIESVMRAEGKSLSRPALQKCGIQIHKERGQRWLGRKLLASLDNAEAFIVIDGLRFPEDHAFLAETFGRTFTHVHVEAPRDLRHLRFDIRDSGDMTLRQAEKHPVEAALVELRNLAHVVLQNGGTMEAFLDRLSGVLQARQAQ